MLEILITDFFGLNFTEYQLLDLNLTDERLFLGLILLIYDFGLKFTDFWA